MALADEIELAATAEELLAEFGRTVSLVPPGSDVSATEPWKGKAGKGPALPVSAVFLALKKELIPGTAVQIGDSLAIIASNELAGVEITAAFVLADDTRQWAIVAPVESRPGDTSFVWFLQIRAAGA